MARILLLTQRLIDRMLKDPTLSDFGVLANPPRHKHAVKTAPAKGCGGCGRRKPRRVKQQPAGQIDYNEVKRRIAEMSPARQAALKERLDCTGIKIQWHSHKKRVQRRVV